MTTRERSTLDAALLAAAGFLLAAGCDSGSPGEEGTAEPPHAAEALRQAKARWEARGPARYTARQTRRCECPGPYSFAVFVRKGRVDSVAYDETSAGDSTYVLAREDLRSVAWTVEEAFAALEAQVDSAAHFEAAYDERLGYPSEVEIDPRALVGDDEIDRTLSGLEALPRP